MYIWKTKEKCPPKFTTLKLNIIAVKQKTAVLRFNRKHSVQLIFGLGGNKMERILMVKVREKTHNELMGLKYKLNLRPKSASNTIQFLIDFYRKNKSSSLNKGKA